MEGGVPPDRRERTLGEALAGVRVSTAVAVLGCLVVVVGSFGPWATVLFLSFAGTQGAGKLTAGLAGAALLVLAVTKGRAGGRILAGVMVAVAGTVAGYDSIDLARVVANSTLFGHPIASVGWGIYSVLAGAVITVVALAQAAGELVRWAISAITIACGLGVVIAAARQTQHIAPASASTPSITSATTTSAAATSAATTLSTATTSTAATSSATTTASSTAATSSTATALPASPSSSSPSGALAAVQDYWSDIGTGNFVGAWSYLAPGVISRASFINGEHQAGVRAATFTGSVQSSAGTSATVAVTSLVTHDQKYGCRAWTGSYQVAYQNGSWLIQRANLVPHNCS
jgi:hypothetical protein